MLLSFFGILSVLRIIVKSVYIKLSKELNFKAHAWLKAFLKCVETLRRDRVMSKDTGELIIPCFQPIFSIAPNAPFYQSLSHII